MRARKRMTDKSDEIWNEIWIRMNVIIEGKNSGIKR